MNRDTLKQVSEYWDSHQLGTQFISNVRAEVGSREYFVELDKSMERWAYKKDLIEWMTSKHKNGRLLEIGCGLGGDLAKFADLGLNVTGIDLAPGVVIMARKHLQAYGFPGKLIQGNAEELSFADNTFDVVYSCGVLQHTPNIQKAIDEIHRVVRPGGMAVVIVYHRYSLFNLLSTVARVNIEFEDKDPPITKTYSRKELERIFWKYDQVGITLEYCYPTPTPRSGLRAWLYNEMLIPALKGVPQSIMKNFGWHCVVKARK